MWKLIQLGNLNAPDTADPDADGIPHILEFAFNLPRSSPTSPAS